MSAIMRCHGTRLDALAQRHGYRPDLHSGDNLLAMFGSLDNASPELQHECLLIF